MPELRSSRNQSLNNYMLAAAISQFPIPGALIKTERFGCGLIHDTYLCEFRESGIHRKYILQRINVSVFKHPEQMMENVEAVTAHVVKRLSDRGVEKPEAVTPALVSARSGKSFYRDDGGVYWRMFHFIEFGTVFDAVRDKKHAYEIGRGLGKFQALVADMEPAQLHVTLPGFHHTPRYLAEYDTSLSEDVKQRAAGAKAEIEFVPRRRSFASLLTNLMDSGEIPLRVIHNDPKVNNIMIDSETHEALCMLDLDTVMPGIVHFDFGDCVRSAANRAGENARDLDTVHIDLSFFEEITRGYFSEARGFLARKEIETLPMSVKVMTYELGLRFLADYFRGDTYFKIEYPSHNLDRARVQFRLLERIEASEKQISELVACIASQG